MLNKIVFCEILSSSFIEPSLDSGMGIITKEVA